MFHTGGLRRDILEGSVDGVFPERYNKYETPMQPKGQATPVYVILQIMDIDEIREETMEFSVQFFVDEIWQDSRLNLNNYKQNGPVLLPQEIVAKLWTPDLTFENSKGGWIYPLSVPNTAIKIHPSGSLFRYTRYNMKIACAMTLRSYPMDTQYCQMIMTPLVNDERKMTLNWIDEKEKCPFSSYLDEVPPIFMANVKPLKYYVSSCTALKTMSRRLDGNYTTLIANFTFVRRLSTHIFNMYIPSALVVALSHLSFWLDVGSVPARVALGITSLLTLATQASEARKHLPPVDYLTALDVWLFVCVLMVFATLVEFATVYHNYYKQKCREASVAANQVTNKAWEVTRTPTSAARERKPDESRLLRRQVIPISSENHQHTNKTNKVEKHHPKEQFIDRVSRILFPISFLGFSIMYWAYYLCNL